VVFRTLPHEDIAPEPKTCDHLVGTSYLPGDPPLFKFKENPHE
jgi:hypothetical protein